MKEITPEIKQRIIALYWGQKVMYVGGVGLVTIGTGGWNLRYPDFYLVLTPLSQITDEDAIELSKLMHGDLAKSMEDGKHLHYGKNFAEYYLDKLNCSDFLRSRGYALPAFGYSVEDLINANIFKLKQ